jgi:arylsulfatase A-like enzyme
MPRPNILLVTADQWRADFLGGLAPTPNIDALAARGTTFRRHYANAAPCSPARACLYTGLYQMTNRVVRNGTPLDARHDTVARMARRAGYDPTLFGYTDQAIDPRTTGGDDPWLRTYEGILPGFSVRVRLPEDNGPWLSWLRRRGVAIPDDPWDIYLPAGGRSPRPTNAPPRYGADDTEAAFLVEAFLDWLGEQPPGRPWFAHLSLLRPHPPFVVPAPFNDLVDPADGPAFRRRARAADDAALHPLVAYWHDISERKSYVVGSGRGRVADWSEADFRVIRAVYAGMVAEIDDKIGRLLAGLEAAGGSTVVVLTADHGEMMGDHWCLGKFGFFEAAYHVPLVVADPRRPAGHGRTVDAFTEAVDVVPTLLDLAGVAPPGHLDGCSLAPFVDGAGTPAGWRTAAHWEYDFREVAGGAAERRFGLDMDGCSLAVVRGERFKYVHFAGLPALLFDLEADPGETVDFSGDPAYRDIRLSLAEELLAWRARHLDRRLTGIALTAEGVVDGRAGAGR